MKLTLIGKKEETPGCVSFIFKPESPMTWKPGQFMRYHIPNPNPDDRKQERYFSISTAPFEENLMITTRFAPEKSSTFKQDLQNLQVGAVIEANGPLGSFVVDDPNNQYVFIAGGIGITPYRAMLKDLDHNNQPIHVHLLYANRDQNIVFKSELESLMGEKHPDFKIDYVIEPERADANKLKQLISDFSGKLYYLSGPKPMVEGIEKTLKEELGVTDEQIKTDYFPGYTGI